MTEWATKSMPKESRQSQMMSEWMVEIRIVERV